jgi:uncharacterized membrane protein YdbT with pleckstrin-like domain
MAFEDQEISSNTFPATPHRSFFFIIFLICTLIAYAGLLILGYFYLQGDMQTFSTWTIVLSLIGALLIALRLITTFANTFKFSLDGDHLQITRGTLFTNSFTIGLNQIQKVLFSQSFIQKRLGAAEINLSMNWDAMPLLSKDRSEPIGWLTFPLMPAEQAKKLQEILQSRVAASTTESNSAH